MVNLTEAEVPSTTLTTTSTETLYNQWTKTARKSTKDTLSTSENAIKTVFQRRVREDQTTTAV